MKNGAPSRSCCTMPHTPGNPAPAAKGRKHRCRTADAVKPRAIESHAALPADYRPSVTATTGTSPAALPSSTRARYSVARSRPKAGARSRRNTGLNSETASLSTLTHLQYSRPGCELRLDYAPAKNLCPRAERLALRSRSSQTHAEPRGSEGPCALDGATPRCCRSSKASRRLARRRLTPRAHSRSASARRWASTGSSSRTSRSNPTELVQGARPVRGRHAREGARRERRCRCRRPATPATRCAAYAARAGIPAQVFMPKDVKPPFITKRSGWRRRDAWSTA